MKAIALVALLALAASTADAQRRHPNYYWQPAGGVHLGGLLGFSFAIGGQRMRSGGDEGKGMLVLVEPGLGGVKLRAGPASVQPYLTGVSLQATLAVAGTRHVPYVGGEFHMMVSGLNLGVGALAALNDIRPDQGVFLSIGIGY